MANRSFMQNQSLQLLKRVVSLYPVVKVGANGAVTLQYRHFTAGGAGSVAPTFALAAAPTSGVGYAYGNQEGVKSVARTGTGAWTITLSDPYQYLIGVDFTTANSGGAVTAGNLCVLTTSNVTTNTSVGTGGTVLVVFQNGSYSATDPASGDIIYLTIQLGDGTVA